MLPQRSRSIAIILIVRFILSNSVFLQNFKYSLLHRFGPECITIVSRVDAVYRRVAGGRGCIGFNVIDVFVALAGNVHKAVGHMSTGGFFGFFAQIEVAFFAVDGPLENEGHTGMGRLNLLYEGEETLVYLLRGGVGEGVEDEGVYIRCRKGIREIRLEFTIAAAAQAKQLNAGGAGELRRVGHSASRGADALGEAGAEDCHPAPERVGYSLYHTPLFHAYLKVIELTEQWQVQQAFVHLAVHVADKGERGVTIGQSSPCGRPKPFAATADIHVKAFDGDAHGVHAARDVSEARAHPYEGAVCAEGNCQAR